MWRSRSSFAGSQHPMDYRSGLCRSAATIGALIIFSLGVSAADDKYKIDLKSQTYVPDETRQNLEAPTTRGLFVPQPTGQPSSPAAPGIAVQKVCPQDQAGNCTYLRLRKVQPSVRGAVRGFTPGSSNSSGRINVPRQAIIQFYELPSAAELKALKGAGVEIGDYVGGNAYMTTITPSSSAQRAIQSNKIRSFKEVTPTQKIDPQVLSGRELARSLTGQQVIKRVTVEFGNREAFNSGARQVLAIAGVVEVDRSAAFSTLTCDVPLDKINEIAAISEVQAILPQATEKTVRNDGLRLRLGLPVRPAELGHDGSGVRVGVWDEGQVDPLHSAFAGRLSDGGDSSRRFVSKHATHVAGTIAGNGAAGTIGTPLPSGDVIRLQLAFAANVSNGSGGTSPNIAVGARPTTARAAAAGSGTGADRKFAGVAPGSEIVTYDFEGKTAEEHQDAIVVAKIDVSHNSWTWRVDEVLGNCGIAGDYDSVARQYDQVVRGLFGKPIAIIFAVGNDRDRSGCGRKGGPDFVNYHLVVPPSTAKNVISVGAIHSDDKSMTSFSNFGPTDDGRIKPDVVAPGCERGGDGTITSTLPGGQYGGMCGTSMAAPAVSGGVALLIDQARKLQVGPLLPSTYKALLIHGAEDLGRPGPDFMYGFGRVRIDQSSALLARKIASEAEIEQTGQSAEATFDVPAGLAEIKVTLVWDDPVPAPLKVRTLVNDLDVELERSGDAPVKAFRLDPTRPDQPARPNGGDDINNVEQIVVTSPAAGRWTLRVRGTQVPKPPQRFSFILTTN